MIWYYALHPITRLVIIHLALAGAALATHGGWTFAFGVFLGSGAAVIIAASVEDLGFWWKHRHQPHEDWPGIRAFERHLRAVDALLGGLGAADTAAHLEDVAKNIELAAKEKGAWNDLRYQHIAHVMRPESLRR